jgi:hypothetical protein
MKIYFAGSIRGGREDKALYASVIKLLAQYGTVLTEHVGDEALSQFGEQKDSAFIHDRDLAWLKEADLVVAEVTTPSLGVGYEVAKADEFGKKTVCLYRAVPEKRLSAMIAGNKKIKVIQYKELTDLSLAIEDFIKE